MTRSIIRGLYIGLLAVVPLAVLVGGIRLIDQHFHNALSVIMIYALGATMMFCVLTLALLLAFPKNRVSYQNKVATVWTAGGLAFLALLVVFTPLSLVTAGVWMAITLLVIPPAAKLTSAATSSSDDLFRRSQR